LDLAPDHPGLSIRDQVEHHRAGSASVASIEDGAVTKHYWYGCGNRATAQLDDDDLPGRFARLADSPKSELSISVLGA
jgi:hypothetical protein